MKIISELEKMQICNLVEDLVHHGFRDALTKMNGHNNFYKWRDSQPSYFQLINCKVDSGVTRIVVIPEQMDWVVKINFEDNLKTEPDYNLLEAEHYQAAIKAGLDEYFAAMYYIDDIDGIAVYAQEKVQVNEDSVSSSFFEYTLENYYNNVHMDDDDMTEDAVNEAAWESSIELENEDRIYALITTGAADELINFIQLNDINDLHSGNWGYRDGAPVIIDYAGY